MPSALCSSLRSVSVCDRTRLVTVDSQGGADKWPRRWLCPAGGCCHGDTWGQPDPAHQCLGLLIMHWILMMRNDSVLGQVESPTKTDPYVYGWTPSHQDGFITALRGRAQSSCLPFVAWLYSLITLISSVIHTHTPFLCSRVVSAQFFSLLLFHHPCLFCSTAVIFPDLILWRKCKILISIV